MLELGLGFDLRLGLGFVLDLVGSTSKTQKAAEVQQKTK